MFQKDGICYYSMTEKPMKIYGLAEKNAESRQFYRLPKYMIEKMPQYAFVGRRSMGGRVRFATDSGRIMIRMVLDACRPDFTVAMSCASGVDLYAGSGEDSVFLGCVSAKTYSDSEIMVEESLSKESRMETVTVNLPRNDLVLELQIGVEEGAHVMEAPEYTISAPIIFYGSSITEGGCTNRVGNAYTSIVSRWLDADHHNYGFSGGAKGEPEFAHYIASLPSISAFVYDYDHNAPTVKHLADTHENFFRIIRAAKPELPVIMMSRPETNTNLKDAAARRDVIYRTWKNAHEAGDKNVWFIDGGEFFGTEGRMECTVDGTHPNALGFMRMASRLYPLLKEILYPEYEA